MVSHRLSPIICHPHLSVQSCVQGNMSGFLDRVSFHVSPTTCICLPSLSPMICVPAFASRHLFPIICLFNRVCPASFLDWRSSFVSHDFCFCPPSLVSFQGSRIICLPSFVCAVLCQGWCPASWTGRPFICVRRFVSDHLSPMLCPPPLSLAVAAAPEDDRTTSFASHHLSPVICLFSPMSGAHGVRLPGLALICLPSFFSHHRSVFNPVSGVVSGFLDWVSWHLFPFLSRPIGPHHSFIICVFSPVLGMVSGFLDRSRLTTIVDVHG